MTRQRQCSLRLLDFWIPGVLEHALETTYIEHVGLECGEAGVLDALVAVLAHQGEQRIDPAHAGPGQWSFEQGRGKAPDGRAMALSLAAQEVDVAQRVRRLVFGEVVAVGGACAWRLSWMGLDQHRVVVEAHGEAIGTRSQAPTVV